MLVPVNVKTADVEVALIELGDNDIASDELDEVVPFLATRVSVTPAGMLLNVSLICEPEPGVGPVVLFPL